MKKFLKITAAIILSLLIFFVGAFKYRQYQANHVAIPKNSTSLVKVNVDEIYKSLALNMISNPGFYLKSGTKTDQKINFNSLNHGLKIKASVYFYTIQNQSSSAFFSRFSVKDYKEFKSFLKNVLHFKITKATNGLGLAKSKIGNVVILYNEQAAALVITNEIANYNLILNDILKEKNFETIKKTKFKSIIDNHKHICYQNENNFTELNFNNGNVVFTGIFNQPKGLIFKENSNHRSANKNAAVSFWLNANFLPALNRRYNFKNTFLESDSLAKYFKGYIDLEWLNTTQQTDSVITYDYNDNFEKVEKITLQAKEIPNLVININADAPGLKNYLNRQNYINPDSLTLNKTIFPLYKIYVGGNTKQLVLSTNKKISTTNTFEKANNFFAMNVDFEQVNKQINQPMLSRYLKDFKKLNAEGKKTEHGKIVIEVQLSLINENINALFQLANGF
ncbi:hypothetical protein [Pedobacter sp. Leaf132]|uniref:hypothetical protein n=1 Tax=Pedobacter sp. Leaf132 TaxID=2876557 RepID=UPI001E354E0A|nr:hypothetical protein [Pedobacter sp. Leaf132]